jgi:hypothetical protein
MFNAVVVLLLSLSLVSNAVEKSIFLCSSPSQTFQIKQNARTKNMVGTLYSASQKPKSLYCEQKDYGYFCKKQDSIAKVIRGTSGRMMVQLEVDGDFDIDSGYLYTIYCR